MAYNKNNYKNQRLSNNQEKFVEEILKGNTQYGAYIIAYPRAKNWKRNSVDCNASQLMEDTKIKQRLKELGYKEKKKEEWKRKKALETINNVMEMNNQDMIRINEAYDEELGLKEKELQDWVELLSVDNIDVQAVQKNIKRITSEIVNLKKQRRVNSVNTKGIYEGAKILNRMFGYDITKVEVTQVDEEKENMKSLSIEELKALAYANTKKE